MNTNNNYSIYRGEDEPKSKEVIWIHHSKYKDLSSPIVAQVYSQGKWRDIKGGQPSSSTVEGVGIKAIQNISKEEFDSLETKDPETIYIVKNDPTNGHEWVDIGMVDEDGYHIVWATKNLGAENPWDAGKYFAWSDTVGYYADEGHEFNWANCPYCTKTSTSELLFSKYNDIDGLTELESGDDAAHVQWGGLWTIISLHDFENWDISSKAFELIEDHDIHCLKFNDLLLPLSGYMEQDGLKSLNEYLQLWTNCVGATSLAKDICGEINGEQGTVYVKELERATGMTIRPIIKVKDLSELNPTYNIYLGETSIVDNSSKVSDYDKSILDPGEDQYAYGVLIDFTQGKSSYDLTRIGNMDLHRELPVQSQYKGCIWDLQTNEIVTYLNPEDWSLATEDKTAEEINDLLIDAYKSIRVETPKFYACSKVLATDGAGNTTMAKVMFSTQKLNPWYVEVPRMVTDFRDVRLYDDGAPTATLNTTDDVMGGYCTTKDDHTTAKSNLLHPITNIERGIMRNNVTNYRTNIFSYDAYKWIFYWAVVIEYATLFTAKPMIQELDENGFHQGGLGPGMTSAESHGVTYSDGSYVYNEDYDIGDSFYIDANYFQSNASDEFPLRDIGVTNNWGNRTGENIVEYTRNGKTSHVHQNRYRGFEFPFGDIMMNLDGFLGYTFNDDNDVPIAEAYFTCSNPEKFQDTMPSEYDADDFDNGWRLALWNDKLDSFHREGYDEGAARAMCIGNNGDLFATKWFVGSGYKFDKYFVNYNYPVDRGQLTTLQVGSVARNYELNGVGLGDLYADGGVGVAVDSLGFRCFNIIQD